MQFFLKFLKIYTILKVTFHFQLIQNTAFPVLYTTSSSLSDTQYFVPPTCSWQTLVCPLCLCVSFFILFTSLLYILDSPYKYYTIFVFLCLTYFTSA